MTKAVVQILNRLSEPILTLIFFEDGYPEGIGADLLSTIERNRGDNGIDDMKTKKPRKPFDLRGRIADMLFMHQAI